MNGLQLEMSIASALRYILIGIQRGEYSAAASILAQIIPQVEVIESEAQKIERGEQ